MSFNTALVTFYGAESYGLRYLASALKGRGFPCSTIFLREWRNNDLIFPPRRDIDLLIDTLKNLNVNLVGIGFVSSLYPIAKAVTERIRAELGAPVVWGGIHATSLPEESAETADLVVIGEGDHVLPEIVERMAAGLEVSDVRNVWMKKDGLLVRNPLRPLIENLDELPWPDIEDEGKFLIEDGRIIPGDPVRRGAEYRIYVSRGCPYRCSYCYNSILWRTYKGLGKYFRFRSVSHVIGELRHVKSLFGRLRRIKVDDDTTFVYGRKWLEEFVREYPAAVGIPFEALIHPAVLKKENLAALKQAGLVKVQVGIESGSDREVKEDFRRQSSRGKLLEFCEWNRDLGLEVVYDCIIDNPFASEADQRAMADLLLELPRPFKLYLYSLTHFPGTELTERLLSEGLITPGDVEGKATKAWRQFRVDASWPRSARDRFYLSIYLLASKDFIPKKLIRALLGSRYLRTRPGALFAFANAANALRMIHVAWEMMMRGELTLFKIRQYGNLRKMISQ
jgi:radical SAM superfamily enzyme YgiQ (UPF0313 family)